MSQHPIQKKEESNETARKTGWEERVDRCLPPWHVLRPMSKKEDSSIWRKSQGTPNPIQKEGVRGDAG